jgi:hypothetical protein
MRKYKNGQHSISQLAAGCILGTMNCCAMVLTLRSNPAIAAQLHGFLEGSWGQFHAIARFFPAINVMMLARYSSGNHLGRRSRPRRVPQRAACIYCYFIKINGAQFLFFKRWKSEVYVATHACPHVPTLPISIRFNPFHSGKFQPLPHARLCEAPVGVLGDASGLHLGDGFEPLSDVVADAETRSSAICPSALAHSKHAPAISRKPARGRMRTGVEGAFKETQGHMHAHTHARTRIPYIFQRGHAQSCCPRAAQRVQCRCRRRCKSRAAPRASKCIQKETQADISVFCRDVFEWGGLFPPRNTQDAWSQISTCPPRS